MANKKPNLVIEFELGEPTLEETIRDVTALVMAISEWDFTPPEERKAS